MVAIYTPLQSLDIRGQAGEPLPTVWKALEDKGIRFLRGQLALIAAGPGTGKSAVVLAYVVQSKVPTLYFSADSDSFTQTSRMLSMVSGMTLEESGPLARANNLGKYTQDLAEIPVRFHYSGNPSLDDIERLMESYDAVYGVYPELVVIDNVTNVLTGDNDGDPFAGLEALMDYLHGLGRSTGSCVIGLHHVLGDYNDANKPIPQSGVKGKITRTPELVITLHRIAEEFGPDKLCVSPVKNRTGFMDPSGLVFAELEFTAESMQIRDYAYR